jgi:hypothetical protein
MQTWARRGLRTALVTGGLLMLGTGIASANENVNPDRPASPLDPQVKVPVRVHDNAIGTPFGQSNTPNVKRDITVSADQLTRKLPAGKAAALAKAPVAKASGVVGKAQGVTAPLAAKLPTSRVAAVHDLFRGNKVVPHVVVPIEIAGNAIAAGGDAHVDATSSEQDVLYSPIWTDGSDDVVAGNVVALDWALPIRISGNAVAALGKATTHFVSDNTTVVGGDILTEGTNGVVAGNVVAGQLATPAQVTGNAVSAAGIATAVTEMDDAAYAPGTITTDGTKGAVAGTGAGVPVALPAAVHGNAASVGGKSLTAEKNSVLATAGQSIAPAKAAGNYIATGGKESVVGGTVLQPGFAGPVAVTCNAADLVGGGTCYGDTVTVTKSGGGNGTNGDKSFAGGSIVTAPLAVPAQVFANAATVAGLADAHHANTDKATAGGDSATSGNEAVLAGTNSNSAVAGPVEVFGNAADLAGIGKAESLDEVATKAGGDSWTNANGSVLSGTFANPAVALPAEVFGTAANVGGISQALVGEHKTSTAGGNAVEHSDNAVLSGTSATPAVSGPVQVISTAATVVGKANSDVCNDIVTKSGGYTGTTGNDSSISGNVVTGSLALPAEVLGNGANLAGNTSGTVAEHKVSTAGGFVNTHDDAGAVSSNAVVASLAGPVQVFGNSASGGGISTAKAVEQSVVTAGGPVNATGAGGAGSGNVAAVPVALPAQVFGLAAAALGKATAWAEGDTSSHSGGAITSDGKVGTVSGNVASAPFATAAQVFGDAAGVAGIVNSSADNTTDSVAGGKTTTSGEDGSVAGNVASAQALPIAQVFGLAAAGTGLVHGTGQNDTVATSGGDITTNGDRGSISGNLLDVPAAAVAQVFGDAAAVGGTAVGLGPNETTAVTGGMDTTSGKSGNLSGNLATVPVGAIAQVFGDAASVVGTAVGVGPNQTTVPAGGDGKTSGEDGSISGNLLAVPVAAVAQVFGNAVSGGGHALGIAPNETTDIVGGTYNTDGELKTLSGVEKVVPAGVVAQVFDIPLPILAHAMTAAPNNTVVKADDTAPLVDLPVGGGGLPINKLPSLRGLLASHQPVAAARPKMSGLDTTRVLPAIGRKHIS